MSQRKRTALKIAVAIVATLLTLSVVEALLRLREPPEPPPGLFFRSVDGEVLDPKDPDFQTKLLAAKVIKFYKPPVSPRMRRGFRPGAQFQICYHDATGDWFDSDGCVEVRFNKAAIREREELRFGNKPEGQTRVLCLGDSFTFGWGIRAEDVWVRQVETELRREDDGIRLLNCGAAGTTVVDEYRFGLEKRFHRLQPDAVVVTLCLNDLLPANSGLGHVTPFRPSGLELLDVLRGAGHDPLALDPAVDWTEELLAMPDDDPWFVENRNQEVSYEMLWSSGNPQQHLVAMQEWCAERSIPFGVTVWPFLQGLDEGEFYPFQGMHERLREFCETQAIPFHDVLPALRGRPSATLWVHPTDMHANPAAQALATPSIATFVRDLIGR